MNSVTPTEAAKLTKDELLKEYRKLYKEYRKSSVENSQLTEASNMLAEKLRQKRADSLDLRDPDQWEEWLSLKGLSDNDFE